MLNDGHTLLRQKRGTIALIAAELGIYASAVSQWKQIPAERVPAVSRLLGVSFHDLRPDIFKSGESGT